MFSQPEYIAVSIYDGVVLLRRNIIIIYYFLSFRISFQNPPQTGNKCLEQTSYRCKIVKWNQLRIFIHPRVTWWLKCCIKICLFWDFGFKKSYVASFFTTITSADIALARHNIIHNRLKRIYTVALLWFKQRYKRAQQEKVTSILENSEKKKSTLRL